MGNNFAISKDALIINGILCVIRVCRKREGIHGREADNWVSVLYLRVIHKSRDVTDESAVNYTELKKVTNLAS